jgi:colicin import membrane protein
MTIKPMLHCAVALAMAVSITACDKAKDAASNASDSAKNAVASAADAAKDAASKAMDAAQDAIVKAGGPVGEAVAAAKKACDEKNYQGALDELKKLSTVQLSPDQQKVVEGMKDSIQKMMSAGAAKVTDAAQGAADAAKAVVPK